MRRWFFPHYPSFSMWIPDAWVAWRIGTTDYRRLDDGRVQCRDAASLVWQDIPAQPVRGAA